MFIASRSSIGISSIGISSISINSASISIISKSNKYGGYIFWIRFDMVNREQLRVLFLEDFTTEQKIVSVFWSHQ